MTGNRSSRKGLWIAFVILLAVALGAGVFMSMRRSRPPEAPKKPPPPAVAKPTPLNPRAVESWKNFVHESRAKCEQQPNCTLDYAAIHQYGAQSFGVMVVAWKDSEYTIDLMRYDPKSGSWVAAPTKKSDSEFEETDTAAASKKWQVPRKQLDGYISKAQSAMREKYGGG